MDFPDQVSAFLDDVTRQQAAAVETACEQAIQLGICGVSVWRWQDGLTVNLEAVVDPAVPYGYIHEHDGPPPTR
jgi:hypothetical protein